jgi:large subunit ribosomal protein L17
MRHGKKINHLGRTASHRKAMLANMAGSLIEHKRINTTVAKAKELKKFVEPLITKSKSDTTHSRRTVFGYLRNKHAVTELFREVAVKVGDRPGGYTRIIKTGNRLGDNAEMCMIELVDFNEIYTNEKEAAKKPSRRRRSGKKAAPKADATEETKTAEVVAEEAPAKTEEVAPKTEAKAEESDSKEEANDKGEEKAGE